MTIKIIALIIVTAASIGWMTIRFRSRPKTKLTVFAWFALAGMLATVVIQLIDEERNFLTAGGVFGILLMLREDLREVRKKCGSL